MPAPVAADGLGCERERIGLPLCQHPRVRQVFECGLPNKRAQVLLDSTPDLIGAEAGLLMRRREIIQLQWGDLELGPPLVLTTQVKGGIYRTKEIADPSVRTALLDYLATSNRLAMMIPESPVWIAHDPARSTPAGHCRSNPRKPKVARRLGDPLTSHGFVKNLKRYAAAAGIPDIHLHQTRHTFARMVGEDAGSLMEVQEALGHKDLATTRVYLERVQTQRDKHSRRIAQRLELR